MLSGAIGLSGYMDKFRWVRGLEKAQKIHLLCSLDLLLRYIWQYSSPPENEKPQSIRPTGSSAAHNDYLLLRTEFYDQGVDIFCWSSFCYYLVAEVQHDLPNDSQFICCELQPNLVVLLPEHGTPHSFCSRSLSNAFRINFISSFISELIKTSFFWNAFFIVVRR